MVAQRKPRRSSQLPAKLGSVGPTRESQKSDFGGGQAALAYRSLSSFGGDFLACHDENNCGVCIRSLSKLREGETILKPCARKKGMRQLWQP